MTLTDEQNRAFKAMLAWARDPSGPWIYSLAGYAGTGKTTLLGAFIRELPRRPICGTPTGKAASVLRRKLEGTGVDVRTIHSILYQPHDPCQARLLELQQELYEARQEGNEQEAKALEIKLEGERARLRQEDVRFSLKAELAIKPDDLLIIDEASMLGGRIMQDLEKLGCKCLFVGDPGQLPPVRDVAWFMKRKHDSVLESIQRQALDSPIIRMSMEIREGTVKSSAYRAGAATILKKADVPREHWLTASQVLCGTHVARRRLNRFFRKANGLAELGPLPQSGDKMICLKNDHYQTPPWINGVQFTATGPADHWSDTVAGLRCHYEGKEFKDLEFYPYHCLWHYTEESQLVETMPRDRQGVFECDFAYAITTHKSQGSEWKHVILADDGFAKQNKRERQQWLYTACTRAQETFTWVLDG